MRNSKITYQENHYGQKADIARRLAIRLQETSIEPLLATEKKKKNTIIKKTATVNGIKF